MLPRGYVTDAPIRAGREHIGAIVLLDDDRPTLPVADAVLRLAGLAAVAAVDGASRGRVHAAVALIDDVSNGTIASDELLDRARRLGCDLTRGATALRAVASPERGMGTAQLIRQAVPGALVALRERKISGLLPIEGSRSEDRVRPLVRRLERYAAVGVSGYQPPSALHLAFREADVALALVLGGDLTSTEAATATWRLLIHIATINEPAARRLVDESVGPAIAHDASHGTQLVSTFRTYLDCGASVNAAAAALPAHRHTIASRLDRLAALTGLTPNRVAADQEQLALGLKAHTILSAIAQRAAS
jgi:sugar diacid utilization regulator